MNPGFFPLQIKGYDSFLTSNNDPVAVTIFLVILGIVLIVALVVNISKNGIAAPGLKKASGPTPRKFSTFAFHRIAGGYGLSREQTRMLEFVFRNDAVSDPERVLKNSTLLDKHFKNAYHRIEKNAESEEDAQRNLVELFSLRNVIENAPEPGGNDAGAGRMAENMAAVISTGKDSFPIRIISAKGETVLVEIPRNALGTPIRIPRGTRVTLSFFTKSSKGFAFDSRVMGTADTPRGPGLQLARSGKAKPLAQRRYRRRQTSCACVFYLVFVDAGQGNKKKQPPKLVIDKRRFTGTILDISIGGCSLKTSALVQVGSRLKLEIDYDDVSMIAVLGQVLRTNRSGAVGTIIHIKFLKIPRRAFNAINAVVFGYNED
ncbi:MAG: flagellar brake protein [Treponema sp.]|nr:flagellar brake protein [Treponema sp.]